MRALTLLPALLLACGVLIASAGATPPVVPPSRGEAATILLRGLDHAFYLTAPRGWMLDAKAGRSDGLPVVFYPIRSSWTDSPVVMYAVDLPVDSTTLDRFVADNVERVRAGAPEVTIEEGAEVRTRDGLLARVRVFRGPGSRREAVAFIRERNTFVLVTMTSRDSEAFAEARAAFQSVVASYQQQAEDVTLGN